MTIEIRTSSECLRCAVGDHSANFNSQNSAFFAKKLAMPLPVRHLGGNQGCTYKTRWVLYRRGEFFANVVLLTCCGPVVENHQGRNNLDSLDPSCEFISQLTLMA